MSGTALIQIKCCGGVHAISTTDTDVIAAGETMRSIRLIVAAIAFSMFSMRPALPFGSNPNSGKFRGSDVILVINSDGMACSAWPQKNGKSQKGADWTEYVIDAHCLFSRGRLAESIRAWINPSTKAQRELDVIPGSLSVVPEFQRVRPIYEKYLVNWPQNPMGNAQAKMAEFASHGVDVGTFRVWGTYRALPTIYDLPEFRELVREFTDSIRTTPDVAYPVDSGSSTCSGYAGLMG